MRSTLAILTVLLACGGPSGTDSSTPNGSGSGNAAAGDQTEPSEPKEELGEEAKGARRMLALFAELTTQMTEHVEARGQDCVSFTSTLGGWLAKNGDEIRDLLILDHSDADHERIDESITETATVVVFGAAECGDSEQALTAYNEWDALVL